VHSICVEAIVKDANVDVVCVCSEFATAPWPPAHPDIFGETAWEAEALNVQITIAEMRGRAATLSK
jgi:hypothetical protein